MAVYLSELFTSFQGEGLLVGRPQLFLRLAGCNLRCGYCDTGYAQQLTLRGRVEKYPFSGDFGYEKNPVTEERLLDAVVGFLGAWKTRWVHSLAVTGGEPLMQATELAGLLGRVHEEITPALPVLLETNGTLPDELRKLNGLIDYVAMDVKLPSVAGDGLSAQTQQDFLEQALSMKAQVFLKLVISDNIRLGEFEEYLVALARASTDRAVPLFLQPMTGPEPLIKDTLLRTFALAREYFDDVRVLGQTHKTLGLL